VSLHRFDQSRSRGLVHDVTVANKTLSCLHHIKPGTHRQQSWIQHGRLCWMSTKSTVLNSKGQSRHWRFGPVHTGDNIERTFNIRASKSTELATVWTCDKLSNSCCCRFVTKAVNKVDRRISAIKSTVDFVAGFINSQLCRRCVPGFNGFAGTYLCHPL